MVTYRLIWLFVSPPHKTNKSFRQSSYWKVCKFGIWERDGGGNCCVNSAWKRTRARVVLIAQLGVKSSLRLVTLAV